MNILFVAPFAPYPPDEGGRRRVRHLVEQLRTRHHVTLLAYDRGETGAPPPGVRYCRIPFATRPRRRWRRALRLLSPVPDLAAKYARPAMRTAIATELARRPDLVWIEESPLAINLPATRIPLVIGEQNVESELWRGSQGEHSLRARYELRRLRAGEDRSWRQAAAIAVVSEEDALLVRSRVPSARVAVIANGVDTAEFSPQRDPAGPLLLVGSLGHAPNRLGTAWFLRAVWPRLRLLLPEATLLIAGPGSDTLTALPAGVQTAGRVDDIRDIYRRGALLLAPLPTGGGSRLKILEAWASGLPVVSTTAGAAGLQQADRHLIIADQPEDFAAAAARLISNPLQAEVLARQARQFVEQHYSWQATLAPLDSLLRSVTGGRS